MPEAAPRSRGGATATVSRPQCLAPPWRPQICDATTLAFPATELSVPCQEPALSTMVDFREPRWFTRTSIFIMRSVNWTIPSKIYSCDLGSARPQETRVCEEIRLCHPGFGTSQHRSSLASEEHICGLTSPRTSRRHMVSTASPNRPGATSKAEQAGPPLAVAVTSAYPPRRSHSRMSRAAHRGGSVPTTSRPRTTNRHRVPPQY